MSFKLIDNNFKIAFKNQNLKFKADLLEALTNILELPEYHYTHSVLKTFYTNSHQIYLDKNSAKEILKSKLSYGGAYIVDYDELYNGGYRKILNESIIQNDIKLVEKIDENWSIFVAKCKEIYWSNYQNTNRFNNISNFEIYDERPPINLRESFLNKTNVLNIDGELKTIKYNFFNIKNVVKFYNQLMDEFYPDFKLIERISTSKIKRYGKSLGDGNYLGLYLDFQYLENELKMTYMEIPPVRIEFFTENLNSHVKEDKYLIDQLDYPIARINLSFFMGNQINFRIGNSSEDGEYLKRELFYNFDIYSKYLLIHLKDVELTLKDILFNKN